MNTAEVELVLRNEIDQDQSFITLDLYSEEKPLGREDAGPQCITESQVTIGLPTINALPHSQHVDRGGWDYYSLYQPFTLHRLEGERNYQSLVFQVTVDNPSVIAADLFPKDVNVELHIENRLSVTSQLKFSCKNIVEVGAGAEIETKKGYINLIPIIIAYGEGEREFYWEYETWKEQPVFPGVKQAAVILAFHTEPQLSPEWSLTRPS